MNRRPLGGPVQIALFLLLIAACIAAVKGAWDGNLAMAFLGFIMSAGCVFTFINRRPPSDWGKGPSR